MIKKCMLVFMRSTRYCLLLLIKLEFSRHISEIHSDIKYCYIPYSGRRVCYMRTDRQTHMTKLTVAFSQFCGRAWKWF